jgi:hypothetical protein
MWDHRRILSCSMICKISSCQGYIHPNQVYNSWKHLVAKRVWEEGSEGQAEEVGRAQEEEHDARRRTCGVQRLRIGETKSEGTHAPMPQVKNCMFWPVSNHTYSTRPKNFITYTPIYAIMCALVVASCL